MKTKMIVTVLSTMIALPAFAIDYSICNRAQLSSGGLYINDKGDFDLLQGQKIIKKDKNKEGKEVIVVETNVSQYFGFGGQQKSVKEYTVSRDDQGRITQIISGPETPSKKEIEQWQTFQRDLQAKTTIAQMNLASGNTYPGFIPELERLVPVKDKNFNLKFVKYSELNKDQRKDLGISDEEFKHNKEQQKKANKAQKSISASLESIQKNNTNDQMFYLGDELNFDYQDGNCSLKNKSNRVYHTQYKQTLNQETVNRDSCFEIARIYTKYENDFKKCDDVNVQSMGETYKTPNLIPTLMNASQPPGMGIGPNGIGGGIGGGMGMYGINSANPVQNAYYNCAFMYGENTLRATSPSAGPSKASKAEQD